MDISDYIDRKAAGLVIVGKIGEAYAIAVRTWNKDTGDELKPLTESLDIEKLQEQRLELQKSIDNIDALIADLEAL